LFGTISRADRHEEEFTLNSRRNFLKGVAISSVSFRSPVSAAAASKARPETICRLNILTSQVGYLT
jgi:hypothetical protein